MTIRGWAELAAAVQALSVEMLDLARADEWEAVTEREERRRRLLQDLFAQDPPAAAVAALEACIRQVLASDAALLVLGRQRQAELAHQVGTLTISRKARLAYATLEQCNESNP
jgi:hypothetical protein